MAQQFLSRFVERQHLDFCTAKIDAEADLIQGIHEEKGLKPLYQLGYSAPHNKADPRVEIRSSFLRATYNAKLVFQEQGLGNDAAHTFGTHESGQRQVVYANSSRLATLQQAPS